MGVSGKFVKDLLLKSYPWPIDRCSDTGCFPCSTGKKLPFSCRIPGASYQIVCTICEQLGHGVNAVYYGETGQNLYTRGKQHISEFKKSLSTNGMVIHNNKYHPESPSQFNFRMEGGALFLSPMDRQIDESLRIKYSNAAIVMNSGSEWRGERIPRARVEQPERPGQHHSSQT